MEKHGEQVEVTEKEASAGVKGQGVRYVLAISLALAILAMSVVWIIPALTN